MIFRYFQYRSIATKLLAPFATFAFRSQENEVSSLSNFLHIERISTRWCRSRLNFDRIIISGSAVNRIKSLRYIIRLRAIAGSLSSESEKRSCELLTRYLRTRGFASCCGGKKKKEENEKKEKYGPRERGEKGKRSIKREYQMGYVRFFRNLIERGDNTVDFYPGNNLPMASDFFNGRTNRCWYLDQARTFF